MNRVELIGRLTNDPDIRTTQSGSNIAKFTLAVRSDYKDNAGNYQTDFIPCVAFRGAENIQKYLKKGYKCAVAGRIKTGSYTNDSGQKVYTTDVIADSVEFLGCSRASGGDPICTDAVCNFVMLFPRKRG